MLNTTCHLLRCYLNITYLNMPSPKSMWILFHATYLANEMSYNNKNEVIKYEKNHQLCLKNAMNGDMGFQICCIASLWHTLMMSEREGNSLTQLHSCHLYCTTIAALSEILKLLHLPFMSPCAWICLLYSLLSSECVWKRKQGQDIAHLNHFPFSCPTFLYKPCVDQQDGTILHLLAQAGTVPSHHHGITGLSPEKVTSIASLGGGSVS